MTNLKALDDNAPLPVWRQRSVKTGHVVAVDGASVTGILKNDSEGVRIGSIIRMPTSASDVFGMVTSLKAENISADPAAEKKLVEIQLLGETLRHDKSVTGAFQRGVSIYPNLGADLFTTSRDELELVYARPEAASVRIGTIHQDHTSSPTAATTIATTRNER